MVIKKEIEMESRISIITLGAKDLARSFRFYHEGLGMPTQSKVEDGIVFFQTSGTRLALYPLDKLAEDVSPELTSEGSGFPGIILSHNTRSKAEVDQVLQLAEKAGGVIIKPAQEVFWGGYSGYFTDPDGYYWEVAWADTWEFNPDGSLIV
jgi:catechol 2,3-dioxygenase-like lactoylglutathione lyase family enzyme